MTDRHISTSTASTIGLCLAALVYLGSVVAQALAGMPVAIVIGAAVAQLAMVASGAIIVARSDVPLLGWLLVLTGSTVSYWDALETWNPDRVTADTSLLVSIAHSVVPLVVLPFMIAIVLFPAGRARTALERSIVGAALLVSLSSVLLMVGWALGVVGGEWATYRGAFEVALVISAVGTIVNHVRSYRGRSRVEQQQVKYFALVLTVGIVQLPMSWLGVPIGEQLDAVMPGVISMTILLAITRYRLYEIDRIISRTVGYALVVAVLAAIAIGSLAVVTNLLPTQDRFATAAVTVFVVALSGPLRRRVLAAVDRRFDRTRYVARQVVEGFGREVQDVTDLEEIGHRVHAVIGRTVAPTTVAVWQPRAGSS